ncbi:hypothetical protein BGZ67_007289 [Mortierella alpina]|nr:hypothetical protein BGZ67_007289 [Mortierella alpina]
MICYRSTLHADRTRPNHDCKTEADRHHLKFLQDVWDCTSNQIANGVYDLITKEAHRNQPGINFGWTQVKKMDIVQSMHVERALSNAIKTRLTKELEDARTELDDQIERLEESETAGLQADFEEQHFGPENKFSY